ncbi:MAG: type II secretion system minor pseudopilin [Candidatus Xenobia bacterium]
MIIIAVLGVISVLFILNTQLGADVMTTQRYAARWYAQERGYYVVRSIVERSLSVIPVMQNPSDSLADPWAQPIPTLHVNDAAVDITVEDEERRFNLNAMRNADGSIEPVHAGMFQRLLLALNSDPSFGNAVQDWLDADSNVTSPGGMESYPNYPCKNGPLDSVAELQCIYGCTSLLYEGTAVDPSLMATPTPTSSSSSTPMTAQQGVPGLKQLCTVHSSGKININTAPLQLIQSVAENMPPGVAGAIVASRPYSSLGALLNVSGFNFQYMYRFQTLADVQSSIFRVTARVVMKEGTYTARVYVQRDTQNNRWQPLAWEVHS